MGRLLLSFALLLLLVSSARATQFWLSPYGTVLGSTPPADFASVPVIYNFVTQPTGSLYIWAKPDSGKTLQNWSLRLNSLNASVLDFTTSEVFNPVLDDTGDKDEVRWEIVNEPTSSSNLSKDLMGFSLTNDQVVGQGIGPATTGVDPLYFGSNAWLLARVDYALKNFVGMSEVYLEIGLAGLNNEGETTENTQVLFGHDTDTPFGTALPINRHKLGFNQVDAKIDVLPTPDADFDTDSDGVVSGTDFLIWQENYGLNGATNHQGDANGDGKVNRIDLAAWEFQYGMTIPVAPLTGAGLAVPEPVTAALAMACALVIATGRRNTLR